MKINDVYRYSRPYSINPPQIDGLLNYFHVTNCPDSKFPLLESGINPIQEESKGQGPGSCNLAACHGCALLPETSCEKGNKLLDRGLVIGTPANRNLGFFSEFLNKLGI